MEHQCGHQKCGGVLLTELGLQEPPQIANAPNRSFLEGPAHQNLPMPRLLHFFQHLEQGQIKVLGVRDFEYSRDKCLEREVWLRDDALAPNSDDRYVVMHVHTDGVWDPGATIADRDWSGVTQIDLRHTSTTQAFVESNS